MRRAFLALLAACDAPPTHHPPVDSPWREVAPIGGGPRLEAAVVASGDEVLVFGGFDGQLELSKEVWAYAPASDTWRRRADLPAPRTHMNVASIDGTVYLLGGLVGRNFVAGGESWAYDPAADAWRELAPLPEPRGAAAVGVVGARVVVAGGSAEQDTLATTSIYDPGSDTWSEGPDLPSVRSHGLGAGVAGGFLIAGGLASVAGAEPMDEVLFLADGGKAYQARASLPSPRGGCAGGLLAGWLVCAGGETATEVVRETVAYDPLADAWITLEPMRTPRAGTHGAVVDDLLIVPGGAKVLRYLPLDTTEVLGSGALPR